MKLAVRAIVLGSLLCALVLAGSPVGHAVDFSGKTFVVMVASRCASVKMG